MTKTMTAVLAAHLLDAVMFIGTGPEYLCICGVRSDDHDAHQVEELTGEGYGLVGKVEYEWGCQIGGLIYPHNNEPDARRDARFEGKYERHVVRRTPAGPWALAAAVRGEG